MLLTFYSILMAVIASTLMIILTCFLKKTRFFAGVFGVSYMVLLYVLSLIRMLVPVELPEIQIVIRDEYVLAAVMNLFQNRSGFTQNLPFEFLYIVVGVVLFVALVLIATFTIKYNLKIKRLHLLENYATKQEEQVLNDTVKIVFEKRKTVQLIKTNAVDTPMITGLVKSIVLIPNREYTHEELSMIFLHECTHLKNNDLWLKLLIQIYCFVFWWNPFVYLLRTDVGLLLELKCDNKACANMQQMEKLTYIQTINNCAIEAAKAKNVANLVASGFSAPADSKQYALRMNNLLFPERHSKKPLVPTILVALLMIAICALSFLFIWQPVYTDSENPNAHLLAQEEEAEGVEYSDGDNAYLVKQEDGNYIFYFDGFEIDVPKEEVDAGYYDNYPIYDEPQ